MKAPSDATETLPPTALEALNDETVMRVAVEIAVVGQHTPVVGVSVVSSLTPNNCRRSPHSPPAGR